jgi:hypothetical protein
MFSLVQAIIFAEAGLMAKAATNKAAAAAIFFIGSLRRIGSLKELHHEYVSAKEFVSNGTIVSSNNFAPVTAMRANHGFCHFAYSIGDAVPA